MKKVFAVNETNAPRMLYILRNVLLALVEQPQATLLDVPRMLTEPAFRRQIVSRVSDPLVHSFWQNEFANWNDRYRNEAVAPIQNKVGQFLTSPLIRHVFASPKNALDLRRIMDDGKILLVNLSHGRLGEDSAALLGALLITSIEQAAKSRADISEEQRRDFYLYADEFQTYAGTESLGIILSQARKYRLNLCLANQLVDQMDPELASTVFGNIGSLCVMQVGRSDAEKLAEELGGDVTPEDLIALPKYHAVMRMLIDGEPTRPFTIRTSPPAAVTSRHADPQQLVRVSSQRYAPGGAITALLPSNY
jgi:type IV secretory pathway TraG/TraD family ATPase VirD4